MVLKNLIILNFTKSLASLILSFFVLLILTPARVLAVTDIVATSSTTGASQPSTMRHLVKTSEATLHSFIQMGTNTTKCGSGGLWWLYSTDSGVNWTCGSQISSDTTNLMYADSRADSSDNIYIVYSAGATGGNTAYDVLYRKLTASNCSPAPCDWSVGSAQTVLDGDASGDNAGFSYATIELEGTTRVWVAVREYDGTNYQVGLYYSDGLTTAPTWSTSAATLDTAGTNSQYHYPTLVRFGSKIGAIYNIESGSDMAWRYRSDSDSLTSWNTEAVLSTTYLVRFPTFSAAGDTNGNVYFAANGSNTVHFSHYLSSWSTIAVVSSSVVSDQLVSVSTDGTSVWVLYTETTGFAGAVSKKLVYKKGVSPFATANFDSNSTAVVSYHATFDKVWLYDASANTYEDETTDAASTGTADVAHSSSSSVIKDIGDIAYFGKSTTFDAFSWQLSTAGTGSGNVVWEYCSAVDGSSACTTWSTLTITTSATVTLKTQSEGAFTPPSDWQASKINSEGSSYYYIRARADAAYTIGPIGTQFRTLPTINWANLALTTSGVYGVWTENATSVIKARYATILSFNSNPTSPTSLGGHVSGSYTADSTPTLTFTLADPDSSDTVKYRVQIDDSSDFSSPVVDYTSALAAQGSTNFTVGQAAGSGTYATGSSGQTLSSGSYYWKVKAIDNSGSESAYSTANSGSVAFIVDATSPTTPGTPSNGSMSTDSTPTWTWTASTDAGSGLASTPYTVQWSTASDFSTNLSSSTSTTNSFTHSLALADGTWYFHVKAADTVGNESSYSASGTVTIDTTSPDNIDLDSPGGNEYTNSERPTFKWRATDTGVSKYVLEIDNPSIGSSQPSGDFTIDNIPVSGTKDSTTDKYVIHFDNFSDADSTNNYISIYTKSHSSWGTSENDGKLREGIVTWRVKAVDSSGNENSTSRTLYVDKYSPTLELTQINSVAYSSSTIATTDKTPTTYGKITDNLSGGNSSLTQTEDGPKVASGPKLIDIQIEKKEGLSYKLHTLYTLNFNKSNYDCDNTEVSNNLKQKCNKYLPFEFTIPTDLDYGTYKLTFTGKDNAGNTSGKVSYTLNIGTVTEITSTETKASLTPKPKASASSIPVQKSPTPSPEEITKVSEPNLTEETTKQITQTTEEVITNIFDVAKKVTSSTVQIQKNIFGTVIETVSTTTSKIAESVGAVAESLGNQVNIITKSVPQGISGLVRSIGGIYQNSRNSANKATGVVVNGVKFASAKVGSGIAGLSFIVGQKAQNASEVLGLAIIKFGYNFVKEPTIITNVKVTELTSSSVKISWETNHPANGKVNYGLDRTYGQDIQSEKRVNLHEFTLTNLTPNTVYHFEVMSQNKNYVYDANREFKTLP